MNHPNQELVAEALTDAMAGLQALRMNPAMLDTIARAGTDLGLALKAGRRVFSCGNGGSMADAMHFAEELTGKYRADRPPLAATAISDPTHLSCVANDYGWEHVFARYIEAHGVAGDCLLAISTSGKSPNVLRAIDAANCLGMMVIGLSSSGFGGEHVDYDIQTPAGTTSDRVQELHIKVIHILIELVEREVFGIGE